MRKEERYVDYERFKARYQRIQTMFADVLLEKERLFTKTLPNAITYDKDLVSHSVDGNPLEMYVLACEDEKLDEKLAKYRQYINDWYVLMAVKERDLRASKAIDDRIYVCRYLDGYGIGRMIGELHYSKPSIYRRLKTISRNLEKLRQFETIPVV